MSKRNILHMNTENRVSFSVSGVIYGGAVIALTAASIILIYHGYFRAGHISNVVAIMISVFIGVSVSVAGFVLWLSTILGHYSLASYLESTDPSPNGPYSFVRCPDKSGVMLFCSGIIICVHNFYLMCLPFLFWFALGILMIAADDRINRKKYGERYREYCRRINRCLPWFPGR